MSKRFQPLWFDPQYRARLPALSSTVREFTKYLLETELSEGLRTRARTDSSRRNFYISVEAVACNLMLLSLLSADVALTVPRAHSSMWGKGRYTSPVYGKHFLDAIDLMAKLGFLTKVSTGYRISAKLKAPSLIAPTERLGELSAARWSRRLASLRSFVSRDRTNSRLKNPVLVLMRSEKPSRICDGTGFPASASGRRLRNSYVPDARLCM